jgi:hypothetical protein
MAAVVGDMAEGPMKVMMLEGFACSMIANASKTTCLAKCSYSGGTACDYHPDGTAMMALVSSPMPGYAPRCVHVLPGLLIG